ncbi:hypothetical protein [Salibacterium aidingense]|uniref:hypothetical protein n=1 Tax=Salibacterium aidingense TaxID=384933 RepID=UPI003BDA49D9
MLHVIFQTHHIPPHDVLQLTPKERRFMYASVMVHAEDEEEERKKNERQQHQQRKRNRSKGGK